MLRIETKSGAVYLYDDIRKQFRRSGPAHKHLDTVPDHQWIPATAIVLVEGASAHFALGNETFPWPYFSTSQVISISEAEWPGLDKPTDV